ncbi:MAG: hypothetical protein ABIC91_00150 [Nanoarchaeota archaeon]|nr:hypothetical protein [Nanoarchaeota archaeon]MBU1029624.1 hypothetical protein [Nanoarchaeota archaeon]MBU1850686.1 hypothetical protein [Nanoarchaeota archaeon]
MADVKITYETLFDILRREKSRDELQLLDKNFYQDVLEYLKQKQSILEDKSDQSELFRVSEAEKTRIQLQNVKKILKELYEKRERKIINLAINKARTGSNIIDTTTVLPEEKPLFEQATSMLSKSRNEILHKLILLKNLNITTNASDLVQEQSSTDINSAAPIIQNPLEDDINTTKKASSEEVSEAQKEPRSCPKHVDEEESSAKSQTVKFLGSIPKFLGRDKEQFGPFEIDDVAQLPAEIAQILIKKGRAEMLK